ncbi:hypothetical protein B0H34DRAFT_709422 [Crassisporium funariophilum]|nr:hypothetical protein B0H34DRAFT_709422 [Crassisporium funariophilum]
MPSFHCLSYLTGRLPQCRRMLSRLVDIPTSIFGEIGGIKWTLSGILLMSAFYTYFINKLTSDSILSNNPDLMLKKDYLAQVKRLHAAQRELEEKRKRIAESGSFRLLDLPPEISLLVLASCADWPGTYLSLVLVSRQLQTLTFNACLPRTPVRLISAEQVHSFDRLLRAKPRLALLVRHLWVTPLKEELLPTSIDIVKRCPNLKSIASNAYMIQQSITFRGTGASARLSHRECKDLTLLSTNTESWARLLSTPSICAFFAQISHLRLLSDRPMPSSIPFPRLMHFSYSTLSASTSLPTNKIGLDMLEDRTAYPMLHTVVLTKPRGSKGGLRIRREAKTRFFTFELPLVRTELELWCDSANQRGMWELCADPVLPSK